MALLGQQAGDALQIVHETQIEHLIAFIEHQHFDMAKITGALHDQIEQAAQMHETILKLWGFPFSVRTFNTMERLAIKTRQQALDLYNTGHLRPGAVRGFGWVSYHEICEWLGVPSIRQIVTRSACPHCGHLI